MRANPDQPNRLLRCDYHKDHNHEPNHCQSLKFLVERLIRAGHLKRFIMEPTRGTETAPAADKAIVAIEHPSEPRPAINFVLGGPIDDQYQSKKQRRNGLNQSQSKYHQYPKEQYSGSANRWPHILSSYKPYTPPIMMHLYSPCVLTVSMCTGSSLIQAARLSCCTFQPLCR